VEQPAAPLGEEEDGSEKPPCIPYHIPRLSQPHRGVPEDVILGYFGRELIPEWLFSHEVALHHGYYQKGPHEYVWMPQKYEEGNPDLRIFYTCVNRMDYCERLLHDHPQAPSRVRYALREIQDRYQVLTLHMEMKKIYCDSQIRSCISREKDPTGEFETLSMLDLYAPSPGVEFSISDLPDLSAPFFYLKYWGSKADHVFEDPVICKLIELFSKHLPYPSKRRSVAQTIVKCWSDLRNADGSIKNSDRGNFDTIFSIIMRILFASLLGVYDHCQVHANFAVRRRLYRWFCIHRPDEKTFSEWLCSYSYVIIYAMREYMFTIVESITAIDHLFSETTYWKFLKRNTYSGTDTMRRTLNESSDRYASDYSIQEGMWECAENYFAYFESAVGINKEVTKREGDQLVSDTIPMLAFPGSVQTGDDQIWLPKRSWFSSVNDSLKQLNKQSLTKANRPIAECFENTVLTKMTKIETEKAKSKKMNAQSVADAGVVPPEVFKRIDDIVARFGPFDPIHFKWLGDHPVNMKYPLIRYLTQGKYLYEMQTTVSVLKSCIEYMYVYAPYDYQVFKRFCQAVKTKRSVRFYDLPTNLFQAQCAAWNRIYQTLPGQTTDDSAGMYYMCLNCGNLKVNVRHYCPGNDANSLGEWTSEGVCIDLSSGKFYCTKASSKNNPKRRNPSVNIIKETLKLDQPADPVDQSVRENVEQSLVDDEEDDDDEEEGTCTDSDEITVNPPERPNKRAKRAPSTEVQVRVKQDKFKKKMDVMKRCLQTELHPTNLTGRLLRNEKGLIMLCPHCVHPMYYSDKIFSKGTSKMSCGCQDDGKICTFTCAVCDRDCSDKYQVHLVYDDTDSELRSKYMTFCERHKNRWLQRVDRLPRLSELRELQNPRLYPKVLDSGDFVLLDHPDNRKKYRNTMTSGRGPK